MAPKSIKKLIHSLMHKHLERGKMHHPFSLRKLLTAAGSAACPRLWLPIPASVDREINVKNTRNTFEFSIVRTGEHCYWKTHVTDLTDNKRVMTMNIVKKCQIGSISSKLNVHPKTVLLPSVPSPLTQIQASENEATLRWKSVCILGFPQRLIYHLISTSYLSFKCLSKIQQPWPIILTWKNIKEQ